MDVCIVLQKKELQIGAPMTKRTVMMPVTAALQEELHIVAYQAKLFHSNVQLLVQAMDNRREELKAQLQDVKIWIHEHDEQSSLPTPWQDDQLAVTC